MTNDRTQEVEERLKAIKIERSDGCSFFSPKEGSIFLVKMCAFCQYGKFEDEKRLGLCKYRKSSEREDSK